MAASKEKNYLSYAFLMGALAVILSLVAIIQEQQIAIGFHPSKEGFDIFTKLIFDAAAMLLLVEPVPTPQNWWFIMARLFSVFFASYGIVGIILKFSKTANDFLTELRFKKYRLIDNKKDCLVIGVGYMGSRIILHCVENKKPVSGVLWSFEDEYTAAFGKMPVILREGDATNFSFLKVHISNKVNEIFIATGNDSRNLQIAYEVYKILEQWNTRPNCYVHISDPNLLEVVKEEQLISLERERKNALSSASDEDKEEIFQIYSSRELVAYNLCFELFLKRNIGFFGKELATQDTAQSIKVSQGEYFHAFIVGFDITGQAIAGAIARLAHFSNAKRSKITIFGDQEDQKHWEAFLDKHPAFSREGLHLNNESRIDWGEEENESEDGKAIIHYATLAEFIFSTEDHQKKKEKIMERLEAVKNANVKACIILCKEKEGYNFELALRLQKLLDREREKVPDITIPIHTYLPTEYHIGELLQEKYKSKSGSKFEVNPFGQRHKTISYDVIAGHELQGSADEIRRAYEALSGKNGKGHVDFNQSNYEAVLHAELKFAALNIKFESGNPGQHLLSEYLSEAVNKEIQGLPELPEGKYKYALAKSEFDALSPRAKQRLCITNRIKESADITREEIQYHAKEVVSVFQNSVDKADTAAHMEHNRWMGERLTNGWSYGEKDNRLKKRVTFVPWKDLTEDQKNYDRQQLPSLILAMAEKGKYAVIGDKNYN